MVTVVTQWFGDVRSRGGAEMPGSAGFVCRQQQWRMARWPGRPGRRGTLWVTAAGHDGDVELPRSVGRRWRRWQSRRWQPSAVPVARLGQARYGGQTASQSSGVGVKRVGGQTAVTAGRVVSRYRRWRWW